MLRRVIDGNIALLCRLKRRRRVPLPIGNALIKVNIGCGLAVAPGWINIDGSLNAFISTFPTFLHRIAYRFSGANQYYTEADYCRILGTHRFIHHDLAYGLPITTGVVDFLYTSHFIEHLFRKDAETLLKEIYRVLKPGGTVRISVPDLEYALSLYTKGEKEKMLSSYFFVDSDESYYACHKYMYDYLMLEEEMNQAGFHNIRRCDFQEGCTPDIEILDNRPEESLFVEAKR